MWTTRTRALVIGGTAVVLVGGATAGSIAVANASDSATPSATTTATPGSTATSATTKAKGKHHPHAGDLARLKDVLHAQWTTKDKAGTVVTHDAIRGAVTAVSSSSITVKSADGVNETYALGGSTKVTLGHGKGTKPTAGAVSDLKTGATVVVVGTGTSSLTADRVLVPAS